MMATTTDSVMANLGELFEMEADRRAELAAAAAREEAEAEARRVEARLREEAKAAAVRAEAKARAEVAVATEAAEMDARLAMLRQELAEVRNARQEMRTRAALAATAPEPSRRGTWMAGVMAAASLVLAVTATAVAWPQTTTPIPTLPEPAPVIEVLEARPVAPVAEVVVEEAPEPVVEETPVVAETRPRVRRPRPPRQQVTPVERDMASLDLGDDNTVLSEEFLNGAGH